MLKTSDGETTVLITQPDHARLSGFLAAHWGNDEFARPGAYAPSSDPAALREEVVFAIAEHDNGWWEWEASPALSAEDGLPAGLREVLGNHEDAARRWRLGVPRFQDAHPYASLVLGRHPYRLYSWMRRDLPDDQTHSLLSGDRPPPEDAAVRVGEALLDELDRWDEQWRARIESDGPAWAREALREEHFEPHVRLLQTLDAFSLALCSAMLPAVEGETQGLGRDPIDLEQTPRRSRGDRVTLRLRPAGERALTVDPYPFDVAPLRAPVRARTVREGESWVPSGAALAEQTRVFELRPA